MCIFEKCCFCVPLDTGIFIVAYVKLVLYTITFIGYVVGRKGVQATFLTVEVIFTIVLVIAAHKIDLRLFQVYFWYSIVRLAIIFITIITLIAYLRSEQDVLADLLIVILEFLFEIYFTLIVRSYILRLQHGRKVAAQVTPNQARPHVSSKNQNVPIEDGHI